MDKKKIGYGILGAFLLVALLVGIFSDQKLKAEATPLISEENIYNTNLPDNWQTFKTENKISNQARIEDFSMTLDHMGGVISVKFKVVDKAKNKYTIFNHETCLSCPELKDGETSIWKESAKEWPAYSDSIKADEFFANLQILNEERALTKDKQNVLFLVRSRQYSEKIDYPGSYFEVGDNGLKQIDSPNNPSPLKGHHVQVLENNGKHFYSDENSTNIIFKDASLE